MKNTFIYIALSILVITGCNHLVETNDNSSTPSNTKPDYVRIIDTPESLNFNREYTIGIKYKTSKTQTILYDFREASGDEYIRIAGDVFNVNTGEKELDITFKTFIPIKPLTSYQFVIRLAELNDGVITTTSYDQIHIDSRAETPVTGISFLDDTVTINIGQSFHFTDRIKILPDDATTTLVTWSVSDTNIATVYDNGQVNAEALGTATLTVTTLDGGFTDTCQITTVPIAVTGIALSYDTLELAVGTTKPISYLIQPYSATNSHVTWTSSNESTATINNEGLVTAVNPGTTTITVTTEEGGYTDTINVTVHPNETLYTIEADAHIMSTTNYAQTVFGNASYLSCGGDIEAEKGATELLIKADLIGLEYLPTIKTAYLWIYIVGQNGWIGDDDFRIKAIEAPWSEDTVTWDNKPLVGYILQTIDPSIMQGLRETYLAIDITEIVNTWKTGTTNHGIIIESDNNYGTITLYSKEGIDPPYIQVLY